MGVRRHRMRRPAEKESRAGSLVSDRFAPARCPPAAARRRRRKAQIVGGEVPFQSLPAACDPAGTGSSRLIPFLRSGKRRCRLSAPKAKPGHVRLPFGCWGDERNRYKWDQSVVADPHRKSRMCDFATYQEWLCCATSPLRLTPTVTVVKRTGWRTLIEIKL